MIGGAGGPDSATLVEREPDAVLAPANPLRIFRKVSTALISSGWSQSVVSSARALMMSCDGSRIARETHSEGPERNVRNL